MASLPTIISRFYRSSIGKKFIVALTGALLVGFLIGHLAGNLSFHAGKDAINTYAEWLHDRPLLVWTARLGLLACVGLHIIFTVKLRLENRKARPETYAKQATMRASKSSRIMIWSGITILAFVIFHLLHFTILPDNTQPGYYELMEEGVKRHDVHAMMVQGFLNPFISLFYLVAIGLLCSHLNHGVASIFQTLGLATKQTRTILSRLSLAFAIVIFVGYATVPLAVLAGFAK